MRWLDDFFAGSDIHACCLSFCAVLAPKVFGDNHTLYLTGAFADFVDLYAAPVAGYRKLVHEAVTTVYLYRLIGSAFSGFRGKEFCHGGFPRKGVALHM